MVSRQPILYHLYILIQAPYQHSQRPWRRIRFEIYVRRVRMLTRRDRTLILMMPVVFHKNVDVDVWEILKRYQFDLQFRFMNPNHKPENVSSINTDITKIPRNTYHCLLFSPLLQVQETQAYWTQNRAKRRLQKSMKSCTSCALKVCTLKRKCTMTSTCNFCRRLWMGRKYLSILSKIIW